MPDLETSLSYCTFCPKLCRHTCPVSNAEAKETFVPQAKMATMRRLRLSPRERNPANTGPLYACTGCGACTEACLHGVAVGPSLFEGRREAEREGRGHPALAGFVERFAARSRKRAVEVRAAVPPARRPLEAQVGFMPGCDAPALGARMTELCDRIGAEYVAVVDGEHACGGYPLLAAGQHDGLRMHAERMARALAGYARVVVHCPACAWLMQNEYPRLGVPLGAKIEHTVEFLEGFAERLPIKTRKKEAFYHDPCYLGRHLGLYDPPRRLVGKAVEQVREFSRARQEAECSGGGGLLPLTMPATADAISEARLVEPREAGVKEVVTACATCKRRLTRDGTTAIDLVELLADATRG
jgi:Fe-S oxidoreductase